MFYQQLRTLELQNGRHLRTDLRIKIITEGVLLDLAIIIQVIIMLTLVCILHPNSETVAQFSIVMTFKRNTNELGPKHQDLVATLLPVTLVILK